MACFQEAVAEVPETEVPPMPEDATELTVHDAPEEQHDPVSCPQAKECSDSSTRSCSPSASSTTSDCEGQSRRARPITWGDLELELLGQVSHKDCPVTSPPIPAFPSKPLAPSSHCILSFNPKQRVRPSTISLPGDASERTPLTTTPASSTPASSTGPKSLCNGILGTPGPRPPLPRADASLRTPSGAAIQVARTDSSFLATHMATSPPSKRRPVQLPVAAVDASQRSPPAGGRCFLSTAGTSAPTSRLAAEGDASQRCSMVPSTPCSTSVGTPTMQATTPISQQPSSPCSQQDAVEAAEATAVATAAAAKAAAAAAQAAAAQAAEAAKSAAHAAAALSSARAALDSQVWSCEPHWPPLFGKALEAKLLAAAPEAYED
eukprot:TRINITY_DN36215_c0_g1_i1.p1 TRINITY_DN36215_c0_g1~~TRINITY_DN36215_c0_g1_i1.p1  ORF type:complete len:378 (+),score=82.47 TRINITY_DN36215_c0_g1_i1:59-1192(+)